MKKSGGIFSREIFKYSKMRLSSKTFWFEQILDLLIPAAAVFCMLGFISAKTALIPVVVYVVYELLGVFLKIYSELTGFTKGENKHDKR